jgi:purine-binding chemotaxis protein CheW
MNFYVTFLKYSLNIYIILLLDKIIMSEETQLKEVLEEKKKNIPKTLQVVNLGLCDGMYAIDIKHVKKIIQKVAITPIPKAKHFVEGAINLRGQIIIVLDLCKKLNLPKKEDTDDTRYIIVNINEHFIGLRVDSVSDTLILNNDDIKPTPAIIKNKIKHEYIMGIYSKKEKLVTLLDLDILLSNNNLKI